MTCPSPASVTFALTEPAETPWLGVVFGYVAMVPFPIGVASFWLAPESWRGAALAVTLFWGCAILTFLSGVRRGVSFRTPGGVTAGQVVTMPWLFCLGFTAIVLTALQLPLWAAALLLLGYVRVPTEIRASSYWLFQEGTVAEREALISVGALSLEVLDSIAARKLEVPLYFARLRPTQMAIPVICLLATIVLLVAR